MASERNYFVCPVRRRKVFILDYELTIFRSAANGRFDWSYRAFFPKGSVPTWTEWFRGQADTGPEAMRSIEAVEGRLSVATD